MSCFFPRDDFSDVMHRVLKRHIVVTLQLISVLRICSAVDLYSSFLPFSSTHNGRKATDLGFVQEKTWKKRGVLQFKSSHRLGDSVVMESNAEVCANTVQGPYLITDNRGRVCPVTDVDVNSGCCSESESKFLCLGCDLDSKCCDNYEYCVSCCQDPTITSLEYVQNISRLGDSKQRHLKSVFLFCQDRCRHNSKSVVHENAYIGELHHCYGRVEKKTGNSVAQEVNEMADLTIVMGMPGQSCEVACATAGTKGQGLKVKYVQFFFKLIF